MIKLRSILTFALVLAFCLSACAPAPSVHPGTSHASQPTLLPATSLPTREPLAWGVPTFADQNGKTELLVVSSVTGKPLSGISPITLGQDYGYTFSPDGLTLAVVSDSHLYQIDLPSWKVRTSDLPLHGWLSTMVYSADANELALAASGPDGDLRVVDARRGAVTASAQAGFSITHARFTRDGKALMVYGPHIAGTGVAANGGISVGAPCAALLASADLTLLWSVQLPGIRDGTFPKKAGTTDIYQPGAAWHFTPGVAFAPDRAALYAVHGDENKLTTVDFTTRKVHTVGIHARLSFLDRLLSLTAGVAFAKGMDGTDKQAVISPDGKYLYVVGSTEVVTKLDKGANWDFKSTPLGLQVIAAADGALVDTIDTQAYAAGLSADGARILLSGWKDNGTYGTPWTDVYDASDLSIVKHLVGLSLVPTHRIDGMQILGSSSPISDSTCDNASIDPRTWAISSDWKGICLGWLANP